jgi:predicted transcriptional regulator
MSTTELRKRLVEKIQATSDESVLEEIYRILEVSSEDENPIVLSMDQKAQIDEGLKDIEEGRYLTNNQANKEIEEWLKK